MELGDGMGTNISAIELLSFFFHSSRIAADGRCIVMSYYELYQVTIVSSVAERDCLP